MGRLNWKMGFAWWACLLALGTEVVTGLPIEDDPWRQKYISEFGPISRQINTTKKPPYDDDGSQPATLRSLVDEWYNATKSTACSCPLFNETSLSVWTNGYVTRGSDKESPVDYETSTKGGGWEELYGQRTLLRDLTAKTKGQLFGSESDYPWVLFATPGPSTIEGPITPASFSKLLGFAKEVRELPGVLKEKGLIREIRATMLNRVVPLSLKAFQTTDETFCKGQSYILNPTFIVAQRN